MKKNVLFALASLMLLAGCSRGVDLYQDPENKTSEEDINNNVKGVFGVDFASNQDWGFGSSANQAITRGATRRAALPATPSFRDTNPIVKPTVPSAYQNSVPAGAKYAKDYQNYQKGDVIYINTAYQTLNQPQNTEDLTIYVDGNVTYCGGTNQNGNGTVFCVTENSTLTLGAVI